MSNHQELANRLINKRIDDAIEIIKMTCPRTPQKDIVWEWNEIIIKLEGLRPGVEVNVACCYYKQVDFNYSFGIEVRRVGERDILESALFTKSAQMEKHLKTLEKKYKIQNVMEVQVQYKTSGIPSLPVPLPEGEVYLPNA